MTISRNVQPGSCFVAVRGTHSDGHAFVEAAISQGAACVVLQKDLPVPPHVSKVVVSDTRTALARLAAAYFAQKDSSVTNPRLIGITGTNGKSTVAWLIQAIIKSAKEKCALVGTIQYDLVSRCMPAH